MVGETSEIARPSSACWKMPRTRTDSKEVDIQFNRLLSAVIITGMRGDPKFDYGDQVKVKEGKHKDCLGDAMRTNKSFCGMTLAITLVMAPWLGAQVGTEVPQVVPGTKPVTVEHLKVHGNSLDGNLEGDAADRDVFVFLPP